MGESREPLPEEEAYFVADKVKPVVDLGVDQHRRAEELKKAEPEPRWRSDAEDEWAENDDEISAARNKTRDQQNKAQRTLEVADEVIEDQSKKYNELRKQE